jgi:7-cyano-7-deazaguanine synthase
VIGATHLFIGANAVDYSGYPDCRPAFIEQFERLANVATATVDSGEPWVVEAPLMTMSKSDIVSAGSALGVDYSLTVSCYQADDKGSACGACDACRLRRKGFLDAGLEDPTKYQSGISPKI